VIAVLASMGTLVVTDICQQGAHRRDLESADLGRIVES
jgi:hypothetical protein